MTANPMTRCPRFGSCSAPLCPLDPQRHRRSHLRGEPICGLLREFVKPNGAALVKEAVPDLFELIATAAAELTKVGSPIYWPLTDAACKKSQLATGRALRIKRRHRSELPEAFNTRSEHVGPGEPGTAGV